MYKHIIKLSNFYLLIFFITLNNISGTYVFAQNSIFQTKLEGTNFVISRDELGKTHNIEITGSNKIEVLDIFELNNPNRLVIDLKHLGIKRNAIFAIKNDLLFKQIRIGMHSDKTRIVCDLIGNNFPEYTWEPINNSTINVFLKNAGNSQTEPEQTKFTNNPIKTQQIETQPETQIKTTVQAQPATLEQAAIIDQKSVNLPSQTQIAENNVNQKLIPNQEVKADEEEQDILEQQDDDAPQGLENIKFYYQKEKNTPLVRFILIKKPEYRIKKESDKRYILTIPEASIRWPHLELPQFPPRDFRGFTMVMPEKSGSDLNIAIGIERGSSISSFTKGNEIWLKIN